MSTGNPALSDLIRDKINRAGPVTFRWFMEQALYQPEHGYYSSGRAIIGRRGDYFTNVSAGPVFGRLLAAQFVEMWDQLGRPDKFVIVEQGAHDGALAHDILAALRTGAPECFAAANYRIVEPFAKLRERQAHRLAQFGGVVAWSDSVAELESFSGVHFSNELFDALPVHLVHRPAGGNWKERYVDHAGDSFVFVDGPLSLPALAAYLDVLPSPPSTPDEMEVNLAALDLIGDIASKLTRGFVLIIDYGQTRADYCSQSRTGGTLQCIQNHRTLPSALMEIGEADISAHVEWTSIAGRAEQCGLQLTGFADQHHFLTGILAELCAAEFDSAANAATRRTLQTVLNPTLLGRTFQVLELTRGVSPLLRRSGFKFGREPRAELM